MKNKVIKIGYKEYEIEKTDEIFEREFGECYGLIKTSEEKIQISKKYNQNIQNAALIHEVVHAILDRLDLEELNSDEQKVNQIATELYLTIKNNPHIFTMKNI